MNKNLLVTVLLIFAGLYTYGQQLPPSGQFLVDSMKIGEPVPYSLSFEFDASHDAVFPDSLYDFSPFEIDHKEFYPTKTTAGVSFDSAVYYLAYFEIDSVAVFSLPVLLVRDGDSTRYQARPDTLFLKQLVAEVPDSVAVEALPLIENTDPAIMEFAVNYPYILIGAGIFLLIIIIVLAVFGKKLWTYIKMVRMKRKHQKFLLAYDQIAAQTALAAEDKSEKIIVLWKKYLQQLERYPYTTLTTKEVLERIPKKKLTAALTAVDNSMYSPKHPPIEEKSLQLLREFASERYQRELVKVKNRE